MLFFSREKTNINGAESKFKYNGIEFEQQTSGFWQGKLDNGNTIETTFSPKETENISVSFSVNTNTFNQKPLYFAGENSPEANYEILKNLYPIIERYQVVCLQGENCTDNVVQKSCGENIVIFKESINNTNIYKTGGCIFIEAPYSEQKKAADRVIFKIFGVQ